MRKQAGIGYLVVMILVTCVLFTPATAGPLNRSGGEPRTNPVVDDMIRIPGVIGMHWQEALAILQQAGLNPIVKTKETLIKKYEGMECTVISQLPLPGGVAMLGASVTISLYMPSGLCGGQEEIGQWEDWDSNLGEGDLGEGSLSEQ